MPAKMYNWNELFARLPVQLTRGEDYDCSQSAIAQSIRNEASKRKVRIKLTDTGDAIIVEARNAVPHTNKTAVSV